jgi:hypothetical protein
MKKRLQKIWKDPVGSKIIANLIWIVLLALGTSIYIFYQKFNLSISFEESWNRLFIRLNQERVVTNWHYLIASLIAVFLLINKSLILKIIGFLVKAVLGIRKYQHQYEYNFTNQGKRSSGVISSERSFNNFKIKPQNATKDWSLKILFSHNYSALEKEEQVTETVKIYRYYEENILKLDTFKDDKEEKRTLDLLDNYIDQEFDLHFDLSHEKGGVILKILRHEKELFVSEVKYGCLYFKIVADDSHLDFDLNINYERLE